MARLPRLSLPGHAHWLLQRAHPAGVVFKDEQDRTAYLAALAAAAGQEDIKVHAFALLDHEVHLLATPARAEGISRLMQSVGRHYVSAHHRRHGGHGTLWAGRFHCALVQPGPALLDVLRLIDGLHDPGADLGRTSLAHRASDARLALLADPAEYWALGNTPFERQAHWRALVAEGLPAQQQAGLRAAARGGWVIGSEAFKQEVALATLRPATPRPRGRPPLTPRR